MINQLNMGSSDSKPQDVPKVDSACNSSYKFLKLSEEIRSLIQKIEENVLSLKQTLSQLETCQDMNELSDKLQPIDSNTNELIKDTRELLQSLQIFKNSDERRAKQRLLDDFTNTLRIYVKLQNEIKEKIKICLEDKRLMLEPPEEILTLPFYFRTLEK